MPKILISPIKQWLAQKGNRLVLLAAICWGLSAPGWGLWPLAWIAMVPAFAALSTCTSFRQAGGQGLLLGIVAHALYCLWMLELYPLSWMDFPPWLSALVAGGGWGLVMLTQGLVVALIWMLAYGVTRRWGAWGWALVPLLWVAGLWGFNHTPLGLPWSFLAYSQASLPWVRQSTSVLSFFGLEALILFVNVGLFHCVYRRQPRWGGVSLGALLIILLAGALAPKPPTPQVLAELSPLVVQGNIPIDTLRRGMTASGRARYYQHLMTGLLRQHRVGLFILPEGALFQAPHQKASPVPLSTPTGVLSGGIFMAGSDIHNGALLYADNRLKQSAAKRVLVPFGETTPFIPAAWLNVALKPLGLTYGVGFTPAHGALIPLEVGSQHLGPLICFEALYPDMAQAYRHQGTHLLVTLGNLAWFHQSTLLESQFLAINQFRAAETGIPLVLSANTGISAFIGPQGEILSRTHSGQAEALTPQTVLPLPEASHWLEASLHDRPLETQFMDY